ncbi:MAG TPA: XdhC family protein [Actinomycetota bacterium]|nr:XdhC family protein [Actinomycetota bacterium]
MRPEVLEQANELARRGDPFVLATVVWRRAPSSGKEGSTALVTSDRRVRGWLGGACAEPTVIREALKALDEGTPRLLFLGPPEELAARGRDGVVTVPIACQSEGALEVYVEPVVPQPHLVVIGRSPAVGALASMAGVLGWRTVVVDEGGHVEDYPGAGAVVTTLDLGRAGVGDRSIVVVATQGHYDEAALEAALATPAAYVGLVASRTRADSVIGYLRDRGVVEESLARVRAPAGLDLGKVAHEEIAVAILAELVRERAAGALAAAPPAEIPRHEALDPVCGMTVDVAAARYSSTFEATTYYFCSARCQQTFDQDPATFAAAPA